MKKLSEYKYLKNRALSFDNWPELLEVQKLIANADLSEDDKFTLNSYVRARIPFMGG